MTVFFTFIGVWDRQTNIWKQFSKQIWWKTNLLWVKSRPLDKNFQTAGFLRTLTDDQKRGQLSWVYFLCSKTSTKKNQIKKSSWKQARCWFKSNELINSFQTTELLRTLTDDGRCRYSSEFNVSVSETSEKKKWNEKKQHRENKLVISCSNQISSTISFKQMTNWWLWPTMENANLVGGNSEQKR